LLISSKAICDAFLVEMPKVAIPPVSEPYSPTRMSFPDPFEPQERVVTATAATQSAMTIRTLIMATSSTSSRGPEDGVFFPTGRAKVKTSFLSMA
jgi:hypothetical protein